MNVDVWMDEYFPHSAGRVWNALTDSRMLARWLAENNFEPRIGKRFQLGSNRKIACEVLELDPPRRMVWSWRFEDNGEAPMRVEFELRAKGIGTRLTIHHTGTAPDVLGAGVRERWLGRLKDLAGVLEETSPSEEIRKDDSAMQSKPMYAISYHKPEQLARLTWLAGTEGMTDRDFQETLEVFAESALQHSAQRLMIDVRQFKHRPSSEILAWRDEVTVAKYNRAGAKKLVWVWPGNTPSNMPTSAKAQYENRYCSSEEEALAWLLG